MKLCVHGRNRFDNVCGRAHVAADAYLSKTTQDNMCVEAAGCCEIKRFGVKYQAPVHLHGAFGCRAERTEARVGKADT